MPLRPHPVLSSPLGPHRQLLWCAGGHRAVCGLNTDAYRPGHALSSHQQFSLSATHFSGVATPVYAASGRVGPWSVLFYDMMFQPWGCERGWTQDILHWAVWGGGLCIPRRLALGEGVLGGSLCGNRVECPQFPRESVMDLLGSSSGRQGAGISSRGALQSGSWRYSWFTWSHRPGPHLLFCS